MRAFDFYSPQSVAEALELLEQHQASCGIIAGGTDIMIEIADREREDDVMIDITKINELKQIVIEDDTVRLGALVTFTELLEHEELNARCPAFADMTHYMGSPLIRNLGTVGGNVVSASVAGDSPTLLMAYDAEVVLKSVDGERVMKIPEFNLEPRGSKIQPNELLTEVRFKIPARKEAVAYRKFGRRKALAIVVLAVSIYIKVDDNDVIRDARVVLGAISLHPMRSSKLEKLLIGRKAEIAELKEILPAFTEEVDGAIRNRPSVVYKREGVRGLAAYCFEDLLAQLAAKKEDRA